CRVVTFGGPPEAIVCSNLDNFVNTTALLKVTVLDSYFWRYSWYAAPLAPGGWQDSHRLYNIGVANEALAYSSEDVSKASTCLEQQNGPMPMTQAFAFVPQHVHARAQTEPHAEQNLALSRSQENTDFSLGALSTTQASMEHLSIQALAE